MRPLPGTDRETQQEPATKPTDAQGIHHMMRSRTARLAVRFAARLAAAAALLACASTASALGNGDERFDGFVVFNTFAWHFEMSDERRDFTPGIGLEYSPSNRIGFHAGTLSDSFGYQAMYGGVHYSTPRFFRNRVRVLLGVTALHKKYKIADEPETKLVPLPAIEFSITDRAVLNLSGSPDVDFGDISNNKVVWLQFKLGLL